MNQADITRINELYHKQKSCGLTDEEKEELTERFQRMYETRDCYILYSRFLEQEGYKALPRLPSAPTQETE